MASIVGERHIKDLTSDPKNARKHNPRNIGLIVDALHEVGAARSIVIDEDQIIRAGNGTVEAAAEAGITKVTIVKADGDEIIAVQRDGWTDTQKTRVGLFDNRTAELATWEEDQIRTFADDGLTVGMFTDKEIAKIAGEDVTAQHSAGDVVNERFEIVVTCKDEQEQAGLLAALTAQGFSCRALMS